MVHTRKRDASGYLAVVKLPCLALVKRLPGGKRDILNVRQRGKEVPVETKDVYITEYDLDRLKKLIEAIESRDRRAVPTSRSWRRSLTGARGETGQYSGGCDYDELDGTPAGLIRRKN